MKYQPIWFVMEVLPRDLASFFIGNQVPGIGGAYQVATISGSGIEYNVFDPADCEDGATAAESREGAVIVRNSKTGEVRVLQPVWDDERLPFDYLL